MSETRRCKLGAIVCEAGGYLKHAYFPQGAVLSLLTVLENGSAIETANIEREGAFGLFAAMYSRASFNRCIVQLEGHKRGKLIDESFSTSSSTTGSTAAKPSTRPIAYLSPEVLEHLVIQRVPLALSLNDLVAIADRPWTEQMEMVFG